MRRIRTLHLDAVLACVVAIASLGACQSEVSEPPFASGQRWTITTIDGRALPGDPLIVVFADDTHVALHGGCGVSVAEVTLLPDEGALAFGSFSQPIDACDDDSLAVHQFVVRAMNGIQRWEAAKHGVELIGSTRVRLAPRDSLVDPSWPREGS